jgi:hypothetical protein
MTVHVKRSTDAGMASLQMVGSTAGRIIAILDACLQDGYNVLASVTVTRTGSVATYTKTAHGFTSQKGQIVAVSGFTETDYNITGPISNVTANTWDMTVANSPSTPGTGSGAAKHAPAWGAATKIFAGTNLASYQALSGSRLVLGVDATNTSAKNTRLRGFESMTAAGVAVASGTNPYPTDVQLSGGLFMQNSSTNDTTARPWMLVTNGTWLMFLNQFSSVTTTATGFFFGDFWSRKSGDAYNSLIVAPGTIDATSTATRLGAIDSTYTASVGHYLARSYTGVAGSLNVSKLQDYIRSQATEMGASGQTYPQPIEGGLVLSPVWVTESVAATGIRGTLPGLWSPCHSRPISHGDTFSGATGTALEGKSFEAWNTGSVGQLILETSDTWTAPL